MSVQVEKLENSTAKLTIEVSAEKFEEGMKQAYMKNKNRFNVQGFRRGKAPQRFIEKMYGPEVLYEDAANAVIPEAYQEAYDECELEITSKPEIEVTSIGKGENLVFTATVAVKPEVKLGQYKGVEVSKLDLEVTDKDVDEEIERIREMNSRKVDVSDRAVEDGDVVRIDFEGFVDGEAFDGGKGTDYELIIGSHSFIGNFEEQIIGHSIDDEFEVNVSFPEDYAADELAGKPAVFKVKLKNIQVKEIPEADDDFASEVSDYETMAEYRESLKSEIAQRKENEAKEARETEVVDKVVGDSEVIISELQIKDAAERMADEMASNMERQGLTMEMYLQYSGLTEEQLYDQITPKAEDRITYRSVLEAVALAEGLDATDDELQEKYEGMAKQYGMDVQAVEKALGDGGRKEVKIDILIQKAIDMILENVVEKQD